MYPTVPLDADSATLRNLGNSMNRSRNFREARRICSNVHLKQQYHDASASKEAVARSNRDEFAHDSAMLDLCLHYAL